MSSETAEQAPYTEEYYLESVGGAEFFRLYGAAVLKPVLTYALRKAEMRGGMTALDAGCGRGELLHHLRSSGSFAVGADFAAAALALAAKTSKAPVLRCDARRLPFRDASFDRIFFLGVVDHMADQDLEACFAEFKRTLRPGGFVLINTCVNTDYHKRLTYALRKTISAAVGLRPPRPPRSEEDAVVHVNEHNEKALKDFFQKIGWNAEIELRPNDKYVLHELYGSPLPRDFPLRPAPAWKKALQSLIFKRPLNRFLARELFCRVRPG